MIKMPHWPLPVWKNIDDYGLNRFMALMHKLGDPHLNLPPTIHIAGTNGKGSNVAFLKACFEAANYKVHTYTSPHLVHYCERITLSGCEIDDLYLKTLLEECRIAVEELGIEVTFFEGFTAAAFLAFARNAADVLILETGMGGRLDATNVIDSPIATVITPISLDHTEYLGPTVSLIAREKAAIIKAGTPCIISAQYSEVEDILEDYATQMGSPSFSYGSNWGMSIKADHMIYHREDEDIPLPCPSLLGPHQYLNAATAVTTILTLKDKYHIAYQDIAKGLTNTRWPGRLQRINIGNMVNMLPSKDWELWIDGAHNVGGSIALSMWAEQNQDKPLILILGMTKGRNIPNFLGPLLPFIKAVCAVQVKEEPSSYSAAFIANYQEQLAVPIYACDSITEAIATAIFINSSLMPCRIMACGSLYLAGAILADCKLIHN
jgi:dihydrofolate synthase/folylpolyglutamate synthase